MSLPPLSSSAPLAVFPADVSKARATNTDDSAPAKAGRTLRQTAAEAAYLTARWGTRFSVIGCPTIAGTIAHFSGCAPLDAGLVACFGLVLSPLATAVGVAAKHKMKSIARPEQYRADVEREARRAQASAAAIAQLVSAVGNYFRPKPHVYIYYVERDDRSV